MNLKTPIWWLLGVGVLLDQLTKWIAATSLSFYLPKVIIPNVLSFQLVHNYGAAYGIFQHQRIMLLTVSTVVIIGVFLFRCSLISSMWSRLAVTLLLVGAIGNLIDRAIFGYVIDFIDIHIIPVFNVADMSINGCVLCFIAEWVAHRHDPQR